MSKPTSDDEQTPADASTETTTELPAEPTVKQPVATAAPSATPALTTDRPRHEAPRFIAAGGILAAGIGLLLIGIDSLVDDRGDGPRRVLRDGGGEVMRGGGGGGPAGRRGELHREFRAERESHGFGFGFRDRGESAPEDEPDEGE